MIHELREGDYVYGWWAVVTDNGTNFLVCLMKRNGWNFLFRLDNRDPGSPGVHHWVMQPTAAETARSLRCKIEDALDVIFAESSRRRQVFVEVMSSDLEAAVHSLQVIQNMGFPVRTEDMARDA